MRIEKLEIKGFGKLQNKVIYLGAGLNVIAGENESGKSTIHTFIRSMLFGMERLRGKGARTDTYSRYEPWENPAIYGGAMEFSCGGKHFRLERNFCKGMQNASLVCLEDGEHLSVEDGDLQMLLGGVNERVFDNTVSVGQLKSVTGRELAAELQSYLANYQGGADEEISPGEAMAYLREKRRDFLREKKEYQERQEGALEKNREILSLLESEQEDCREKLEETRGLEQKLGREAKAEEETGKALEEEHRKTRNAMRKKWKGITAFWSAAAVILLVLTVLFRESRGAVALGALAAAAGAGILISRLIPRRMPDNVPVMEEGGQDTVVRLQEIRGRRQQLEEELKERSVRLDNLRQEFSELEESRWEPVPVDEEIAAIDMAMDLLNKTTIQMQQGVGSRLRIRMGEILGELTGGIYTSVHLDENMEVELQTIRRRIQLHQLSRGTLEQVYLALRMAAGEVLCREEELPAVLDDVFPMYDDVRLLQSLRWLWENREQTILLTCHQREGELLKKEGLPCFFQNLGISDEIS